MIKVETVDVATAKTWLDRHEALIIDVREVDEYERVHLLDSQLIPLGNLDVASLPPLSGKKLIIHCQSGRRSEMACASLLHSKPELEVYNLQGGIIAWQQAGLVVVSQQ